MARAPAKKVQPASDTFKAAVAEFCEATVDVIEGNNLALSSGTVRKLRGALAAVHEAAGGPAAEAAAEA